MIHPTPHLSRATRTSQDMLRRIVGGHSAPFSSVIRRPHYLPRPQNTSQSTLFRRGLCWDSASSSSEKPKFVPSPHLPLPDSPKTFTLPDGRLMGYAEYGAPGGRPVILAHGTPDCRLDCCTNDEEEAIAKRLNVRWIGVDRPGMGLSTYDPNRKILDWKEDLGHLVDHLGLDTFHVFGISGGTPYALSSALKFPKERLLGVGVMVGIGPPDAGLQGMHLHNKIGMLAWWYTPWLMESILNRFLVPVAQDPDRSRLANMFRKQARKARPEDKALFEKEEMTQLLTTIFKEVYRQGSARGHAHDFTLVNRYWGFDMADVKHENIKFWYGALDGNTPPHMGQYMAERIPGSTIKIFDGKSHFTAGDHMEEMLNDLFGAK